jgi:phage tail tape-measure protein
MSEEARDADDFTVLRPHSAPEGRASHETVKTDAENVGEGAGTFLGGVTGAALGVVGGPVGLVLGAIAGALGGWWAGHGVADAFTSQDEAFYRAEYEGSPTRLADRDYAAVSPAYAAGHLAGRNPEWATRSFEEVEPELRRGWSDDVAKRYGEWSSVRDYARVAFDRARATPGAR